jgi:hypothetical protein
MVMVRDASKRPRWTQVIRDRKTNQIIAEYSDGQHLSPMDIDKKHGTEVFISSRRE